jgi:serine/threonine protein phosphatase PrpC
MHSLQVHVGFASEAGKRAANEDYCAARESNAARAARELTVAIADGMGGGPGGRLAAEMAVRGFIDGYFGLPETLGPDRAAAQALTAMNRWIYAQGRQDPRLRGMATTFSALILRGRSAHVVHVGDSRVYRLRDRHLQCLTQDHTHAQPDLRHVLYRAVGLEETLRVDYGRHDLRAHDRFLLCSDGVHGALRDADVAAILSARGAPEEDARRVVAQALVADGQDNATAIVVDVIAVPAAERGDLEIEASALSILELPKVGDLVDGFRLLALVAEGRYSRLFHAEDTLDAREVILKFPHPRVRAEAAVRRAFVREAWIAQQVQNPYVVELLAPTVGRQTRLYTVMPYYRGETLEARLRRAPPVTLAKGVDIGVKLGRAIHALNRRRIIHRDIKPENVLLHEESDAGLKLLDLGVARLPGTEETSDEEIPGTPSYMAPELLQGAGGDDRSEVYALGVTLYRLFSGGQYPYGEVEAFSHPRFGKRTPLARYRPDLPAWLDVCLGRAVAVNPEERFGDTLELAFDLEHNLAHGPAAPPPRRRSLYERNPLRFWQVVSLLLFIALMAVIISR